MVLLPNSFSEVNREACINYFECNWRHLDIDAAYVAQNIALCGLCLIETNPLTLVVSK